MFQHTYAHVYFVTFTLSYIPNERTFDKPGTMSCHPVSRTEDWSAQHACHPQSSDPPFPRNKAQPIHL